MARSIATLAGTPPSALPKATCADDLQVTSVTHVRLPPQPPPAREALSRADILGLTALRACHLAVHFDQIFAMRGWTPGLLPTTTPKSTSSATGSARRLPQTAKARPQAAATLRFVTCRARAQLTRHSFSRCARVWLHIGGGLVARPRGWGRPSGIAASTTCRRLAAPKAQVLGGWTQKLTDAPHHRKGRAACMACFPYPGCCGCSWTQLRGSS